MKLPLGECRKIISFLEANIKTLPGTTIPPSCH